jgi:hypothetical protein
VADAVRDAVFRVQLVFALDHAATEVLRFGSVRSGHLYWQLRAISAEWQRWLAHGLEDELGSLVALWEAFPAALAEHRAEIEVEAEARSSLQARYLDGRGVLFSDTLDGLHHLRRTAELMAAAWAGIPGPPIKGRDVRSSEGAEPSPLDAPQVREPVRTSASSLEMVIAKRARVMTLDVIGDVRGGLALLTASAEDGGR